VTNQFDRLDAALGAGLERLVVAHHRRRLRRLSHLDALDAPGGGWALAKAGFRPTTGNALDVLVDGGAVLPAMADEIESAREFVWLAGWYFSPDFRLRPGEPETLREVLAAAAERVDVRVLAWAGSPLPLFHPDRRQLRKVREQLTRGTRVSVALDDRERPMHCHHEKLVIVDGRVAFVGGIDLTSYDGDRLDRIGHPPRNGIGWHDGSSRLCGPAVADVAAHFRLRWEEVTGEPLPTPSAPAAAGEIEAQVVRTVPERIYRRLSHGDFGILESYLRALRSAERLVYIENQFLWSPEIVSVLAGKLRRPPTDEFRLVALLPVKPNSGREDTRGQLGVLAEADGGAGRLLACTLHQPGPAGTKPAYVHAKIAIVDDRWLSIGSANLNEHSLFNDTEMNVVTHDTALARTTRIRLWSEHLNCDPGELAGNPAAIIDTRLRPTATEQLQRRERGSGLACPLMLLPAVSRRSARLNGPLNGLLVDG